MDFLKRPNGQSVIEILLAIALLSLATTSSFTLISSAISEGAFSDYQSQGQTLLVSSLEAVRQIRDREWDLLAAGNHGLAIQGAEWIFSGTEDIQDGRFHRTITVTETSADEREARIRVSWDRGGRTVSLESTAHLTNWKNLEVWGNWGQPYIVASLDIGPEGEGTGVSVLGNHVFMTAEDTHEHRPTFFSINTETITDPFIESSGPPNEDLKGVVTNDEANIVYTIGVKTGAQLRVFDVSNPASPVQVATRSLLANGHMGTLAGSYLYVGAANGMHIFTVSDPGNPIEIGTFSPGVDVRGISVSGTIAYLATPNDNEELMIVDVSNPASPVKVGSANLSGSVDGLSVAAYKNKLYVGRYNNSSTQPEIYIFDRTAPTAPVLLNSIDNGGPINSMIAAGPYLFTATNISNREFTVYDVRDPLNVHIEASLNMSQVAAGLDLVDNTIYISLRSNDAFQIIRPQ